ncbi:unnamed protein product [Medioppia subpectinata]|uniref:F-box domain-containing protein n=1 Tax=Medioppia subpectinata TaxID=1979941 RepID=A0A7R9PYM7_9ACAR|nr:unnamed protein product [Medioppia subpectinata]CAG2106054.1 unnamed protein product [Medioppia subpectinata]
MSMKHLKTSLETSDEEGGDIQQPQIYAKNSMDRFGDDLCALLLSYLPFKDRFRCECVSKQFQRTVFGSVVHVILHKAFISFDTQLLATIAKKCPNIQTIECRVIGNKYEELIPELLSIFRDNCRHLRHIYCNLRENSDQLCLPFGPLVTQVGSVSFDNKRSLILCHRLSHLVIHSLYDAFDYFPGRQLVAKNLQSLAFYNFSGHSNDQLSALVAGNQSIRCLKLVNRLQSRLTPETLTEMCGQLSRLTQLRRLTLELRLNDNENSLNNSLRTIGEKCWRLQRLTLELFMRDEPLEGQPLEGQPIDALKYYRRLKRLHLTLDPVFGQRLLEPLKLCHRLTHLTIWLHTKNDKTSVDQLLDNNCGNYWPRLQYLYIRFNEFGGQCLDHIPRLPALQTLVFHCRQDIGLNDNEYSDLLSRNMAQQLTQMMASLEITDENNEDNIQQTQSGPAMDLHHYHPGISSYEHSLKTNRTIIHN